MTNKRIIIPKLSISSPFLVAEIGLNHKGSEDRAFSLLKKLVKTDVNAITFQILADDFYQKNHSLGGPLSEKFYKKAINFVHTHHKLIGFSIKDQQQIAFFNKNGADFWKTLSTSIKADDLLKKLQATQKPLFVSTGLSSEKEIKIVAKKFRKIKLIHTQLSHEVNDANLRAIARLEKITSRKVAFGLHCPNFTLLYLSLAFNPATIFFYVKDNLKEKFPDNEHAICIDDLKEIINQIKLFSQALGNGIKKTTTCKIK
jgi:N-acetylneuraminate synthase